MKKIKTNNNTAIVLLKQSTMHLLQYVVMLKLWHFYDTTNYVSNYFQIKHIHYLLSIPRIG